MAEQTVKVLEGSDGVHRVRIVKRGELYGLVPERHFTEENDGQIIAEGWSEFPRVASFFSDVETAEQTAMSRYPWLGA